MKSRKEERKRTENKRGGREERRKVRDKRRNREGSVDGEKEESDENE